MKRRWWGVVYQERDTAAARASVVYSDQDRMCVFKSEGNAVCQTIYHRHQPQQLSSSPSKSSSISNQHAIIMNNHQNQQLR